MKARKGPDPLSAVTNSGWTSRRLCGGGGDEEELGGVDDVGLMLIFSFVVEGGVEGIKLYLSLSPPEGSKEYSSLLSWEKRRFKKRERRCL